MQTSPKPTYQQLRTHFPHSINLYPPQPTLTTPTIYIYIPPHRPSQNYIYMFLHINNPTTTFNILKYLPSITHYTQPLPKTDKKINHPPSNKHNTYNPDHNAQGLTIQPASNAPSNTTVSPSHNHLQICIPTKNLIHKHYTSISHLPRSHQSNPRTTTYSPLPSDVKSIYPRYHAS